MQTEGKTSLVDDEHQDVGTWNEKGIGLHSPDYITLCL